MNAVVTMQTRVEDYLAERRRLGYRLRSTALALRSFARYVDGLDLSAPLSVEVMAAWARQAKTNSDNPTRTGCRRPSAMKYPRVPLILRPTYAPPPLLPPPR